MEHNDPEAGADPEETGLETGAGSEEEDAEGQLVDQSGRVLGPRALRTRQRLLESTAGLLERTSLRDLRVSEIARGVGTSPATFYQYFKDVEEAVLALAEQATSEMPAILDLIEGSWEGPAARIKARAIADAFVRHWDTHHAVLLARNISSDEGDPRFQEIRNRTMAPVLVAFADKIAAGQKAGVLRRDNHPHAAAAALAAVLERLAAYHKQLERVGVERDALIETSANIVVQIVTGRNE